MLIQLTGLKCQSAQTKTRIYEFKMFHNKVEDHLENLMSRIRYQHILMDRDFKPLSLQAFLYGCGNIRTGLC